MAFGSAAGSRVAYVAEVTPGTVPSTPTFKQLRVTGGGLRTNKTTVRSDELQPHRNVLSETQTGQDVSGSYPFELTYATFDDILAGALFGAWSTNVLKNGLYRQYFTFEETLELGATDSFSRFPQGMVSSISLDVTARQAVTGSFSVMAQKETLGTSIVSGATYTAPNTKAVMDASAGVTIGTVASVSGVKLRRIQFEVNNNLRIRPTVGGLYSEEYGEGQCDVTGTIEAYFSDNALYQKVLDHGGGDLNFTVGTVTTEKYTIDLPNVVFLNGGRPIGGRDSDIMISIPFRALYDGTSGASIVITRAVT